MHLQIVNPDAYRAALYIRLSKEDDSDEPESQSVANQRSMLGAFAEQYKLSVYGTYIDDGFSGTSFDRPGFKRMIEDIEHKKVNMVITKDMSRLGRDYIQTGHYLERYFPENNVRYISLLDGIDTGVESTANDITPFRAIMNDMYAKDISKKIKSVKHDKQKRGLFIGGKAVYGYQLSKTAKNKIEIDEEAAPIVRRIFALALGGSPCRQIAARLNEEKIPPPSVYAGLRAANSVSWSAERVSDMLQNPTYTGSMAQGKSKRISYKSKKSVRIRQDDWIVVEAMHEPIIDRTVFDQVALMMQSRRKTRTRTYDFLLKGIIRCRECGQPLSVVNRPNAKGEDTLYFICRTYQRASKACTCHSVKVGTVTEAVLKKFFEICGDYLDVGKLEEAAQAEICAQTDMTSHAARLAQIDRKLASLTAGIDRMYADKLAGMLDERDFCRLYMRARQERTALEERKASLAETQPMQTQELAWHLASLFLKTKEQNKALITSLIEKVELTEDKQIYIYFRFHLH